jgi:outer membrane autotransporter protein
MEKKSSLKKFLATASAFAVIAGAATSAMGAQLVTAGNVAALQNGYDINLTGPFASGVDHIRLGGAHNITTGGAVVFAGGGIVANGNLGQTFTVGHDVTIGAGVGNIEMNVILNAGNFNINDITENVTINGGVFNARDLTGAGAGAGSLTVNGGTATVNGVASDVVLANAGELTTTGTITGTLTTGGASVFKGDANAGDVTGAVVIDTTSETINTLHNAAAAVTLTKGKLTMNDATGGLVTVTAGELIMNDAANNLTVNGGTATVNDVAGNALLANAGELTTTGTITGTLTTGNASVFKGHATTGDVTGAVVIDTTSETINTLHDAAAAVTLTKGKLTMNDSTTGGNVTVTAGELIMHDITAGNLLANGGTTKVNAITNDVTVDGANNANVTVASVGGNVTLANSGNLSVATKIGGTVDGAGTLTLTKTGEVTGAVGGVTKVTKIVAQADRTFAHAGFNATELAIEGSNTVTFTLADLFGTNVTTTETNRLQNIIIDADQTITGDIGTAQNQLGSIIANTAGKTINIKTLEFNAGVKTNVADATKVDFILADAKVRSLGDSVKQLLQVKFTESGSVADGVYSKEVRIDDTKTATLGGIIKSSDFELTAADSKVIFAEGAKVQSIITSTGVGEGLAEVAGNVTISQNLGEAVNTLKKVTFADDATKTADLGADIFATDIATHKSVVQLTKDVTLNGATATNATTFDLANQQLTFNGDLTVNGVNTIKFAINDAGTSLSSGKIVINAGKALAFEADAALVIAPQDLKATRPTGGATRTFELVKNNGTLTAGKELAADKVTLTPNNPFITWTIAGDAKGGVILTQVDNAAKKLKELLAAKADATDNANIDALANAAQGTDGAKVIDLLGEFALANNTDKIDEAIDRLTGQTTVTDALEDTIAGVGESLGVRAMSLAGNQGSPVETRTVSSERTTGVSAGDEHARFGAWFSPFFNKTTQKARKGAAGYKSEAYGASFGFDTRANDDMIIGAAVTASNSELKHKNFKSGDKTKVNSLLFSIYGMQQITDSWFALGSVTFGTNEVKNREKRVALTGYEIANGKYSSMSFSGEAMFGYNYITEQATLTPMAGLRYTRVNNGGYKESGTTFQNLDVTTKASNKFEVIVGARASGGTFDLNGLTITPEVHGFINYDLINKNAKSSIKLDGAALTAKANKPVRATYNLGLGANAEYGMMEYGASYDAQLANKRVGHQGTLRLRVNF